MSSPLVVIVTGANRGIGQAICEGILALPSPITLYACSRAGKPFSLSSSSTSTSNRVHFPALDISDPKSISALKERVQEEQKGGVDVLVNNAGVNLDGDYGVENARKTLEVNYEGTLAMCTTFLLLLTPKKGRIVNISSVGSMIKSYSPSIQSRFRNVKSLDEVEGLAKEFMTAVEQHKEADSGWFAPRRSYSVSKALINAFTIVLAEENPEVLVNCCCPGWVATEMGRQVGDQPSKSPQDGATIPLRLAFDPINNTTGKYWANTSISSTDRGDVQDW